MEQKKLTQEEKDALLASLSPQEKEELLNSLSSEVKSESQKRKEAYEAIRGGDFVNSIKDKLGEYRKQGREFKNWLRAESEGFFEVLKEYGKLKRDDQIGFTIGDEEFRFQVKANKVKGFDERADAAEKRLVDFLRKWVENREGGVKNPMYKLAMAMIQRNEAGDLDYKSISRLYELEQDFNDPDYSEIMQLFKESNTTEKTVTHYYFEERTEGGKWTRIEPSFNKM